MSLNVSFIKFCQFSILLTAAVLASGCASVPGPPDQRDPFESYNRAIYKFNTTVDDAAIRPVAQAYADYTPDFIQSGVSNFFSNLGDVIVLFNDLLQFKLERAGSDFYRIAVNSTLGIFGLFDPATYVGLSKHKEDFGQTLATWGVPSGPYFMLPLIGPSTIRGTAGLTVDIYSHPLFYYSNSTAAWGLAGLAYIDQRTKLLGASRVLDQAALDPYIFTREAYLQHRRNLIYDGNPPPPEEDKLDNSGDDADADLELELELEKDTPKTSKTIPAAQ